MESLPRDVLRRKQLDICSLLNKKGSLSNSKLPAEISERVWVIADNIGFLLFIVSTVNHMLMWWGQKRCSSHNKCNKCTVKLHLSVFHSFLFICKTIASLLFSNTAIPQNNWLFTRGLPFPSVISRNDLGMLLQGVHSWMSALKYSQNNCVSCWTS